VTVKQLLERVPADREAEDRAWAVVRAAYGEREHVRAWPRRRLMLIRQRLRSVSRMRQQHLCLLRRSRLLLLPNLRPWIKPWLLRQRPSRRQRYQPSLLYW